MKKKIRFYYIRVKFILIHDSRILKYFLVPTMKTVLATDFYPSSCTYTGDKVVRHRCASLLQCRTTLALLRSALRRGRFIPEIYFLLKRPPKTVLSSRSDVPSRFLHGQVLRFKVPPSCSLKNEFAPATKEGEGEVGEAKGKTTLEKRTIVLFYLNACMRRTR